MSTPTSRPTAAPIDNCNADSLGDTISGAVSFFVVMILLFEAVRRIKALYLKRYRKKFRASHRVPNPQSAPLGLFAWIPCIFRVDDNDFLRMVGLDGLMYIRFIMVCFKVSVFLVLFGFSILLPVYSTAGGDAQGWCQYTLSNIPDEKAAQLWVPVVFAYIFSAFFCNLMYEEYRVFVKRRLLYFEHGDPETPNQAYYTAIIENLSSDLQNAQALAALLEDIFPGKIHSIEVSLDLRILDSLVKQRLEVCSQLEKKIAYYRATKKRPMIYVPEQQAQAMRSAIVESEGESKYSNSIDSTKSGSCLGYKYIDAIDYYKYMLSVYNSMVSDAQRVYLPNAEIENDDSNSEIARGSNASGFRRPQKKASMQEEEMQRDIVLGILKGATNGALKGLKATTETLKLLTIGTQKRSSTAFVTFNSREAVCKAVHGVLTHDHFDLSIKIAPNPFDILWYNVHFGKEQYDLRHYIAGSAIYLGALFWSFFVAFITTAANLDSIAEIAPWLEDYKKNNPSGYAFINSYLAYILLFIIIAILPLIFDLIARKYEHVKCESKIQESIMNRFFYYQLANVVVSITALTVQINIDDIINDPASVIALLGDALPQVSLYFAGFMTLNAFMMVPLELCETWPLICYSLVVLFTDKKKSTRRDLRTKAFSDFPMLYGWVYPMQLLSLMIMTAYSCIAPLLMPFCCAYFGFSYMMYKYQLLFVYVNKYQTGGSLWYSVFSKSMISLMGGVLVLLAYIILKSTSNDINGIVNGPLYCLLPLPLFILYFWRRCDAKFENNSKEISIHSAVKLDRKMNNSMEQNRSRLSVSSESSVVADGALTSSPTYLGNIFPAINLYKQPSLLEQRLVPEPYRRKQGIARSQSVDMTLNDVLSPISGSQILEENLISETYTSEMEEFFEEACDEVLGTLDPETSEFEEESPILDGGSTGHATTSSGANSDKAAHDP